MQVVCGNCQGSRSTLPEGNDGTSVWPESAGTAPSRWGADGAGGDAGAQARLPSRKTGTGGALHGTFIAPCSRRPAVTGRAVEVIPMGADSPIGEVHLVGGRRLRFDLTAGEATGRRASTGCSRSRPRALPCPPGSWPHPDDGRPRHARAPRPGDRSTADRSRTFMRYLPRTTSSPGAIEVLARQRDGARVDYRRRRDQRASPWAASTHPSRLAEVMQWASGKLPPSTCPPSSCPAVAPKRTDRGPRCGRFYPPSAPRAPRRPVAARRRLSSASPQSEIAGPRAPARCRGPSWQAPGRRHGPRRPRVAPSSGSRPGAPVSGRPRPSRITPPGVPRPRRPGRPLGGPRGASATKTMFGVSRALDWTCFRPPAAAAVPVGAPARAGPRPFEPGRRRRATRDAPIASTRPGAPQGRRSPRPAIVPPDPPRAGGPAAKDVGRTTQFGFESGGHGGAPRNPRTAAARFERIEKVGADAAGRACPTPSRLLKAGKPPLWASIGWTYIGVRLSPFGIALIGIYQLVGRASRTDRPRARGRAMLAEVVERVPPHARKPRDKSCGNRYRSRAGRFAAVAASCRSARHGAFTPNPGDASPTLVVFRHGARP